MERYGKTFKEMNLKEKLEYLWEYYRKPALFVAMGVFLVVGLIIAALSPKERNSIDIVLTGQINTNDTDEQIKTELKNKFDAGFEVEGLDWSLDTDLEKSVAQKIVIKVTTNQLDILGVPEAVFDNYLEKNGQSMYLPLEELPEFKDILKAYEDQLVKSNYNMNEEGDIVQGEEHVYGINISKIDNLPNCTFNEEIVLGVTATTKDINKAVQMMQYLLEDK